MATLKKLALAYTTRSQPIIERSQGQNTNKNLKKITGMIFADLLRFMLLDSRIIGSGKEFPKSLMLKRSGKEQN